MSDPWSGTPFPRSTRREVRRAERRRASLRRRTVVGAATAGVVAVAVAVGVSLTGDESLVPVVDEGSTSAARYAGATGPGATAGSAWGEPGSGASGSSGTSRGTAAAGPSRSATRSVPPAVPPTPTRSTTSEAPPAPDPEPAAPSTPPAPPPAPAAAPAPDDTAEPAPRTAVAETSAPAPAAPPSVDGSVREQILQLVNSERAAAGCGALVTNDALAAAAQGHAEDMKAKGYFSHTGQDGSSPFDRMRAAGYDYRAAGENIARGQRDAREVMAAWMTSPGHRANILNCDYRELGVGHVEGGDGPWWVQNFGSR